MNDTQLLRYSRHILLDEIGIEGQTRISCAKVLLIGVGGLGSPAALYLAASGVGQLTLCDDDTVELSNLQRQIAHQTEAIGQSKVSSAVNTLQGINPDVLYQPLAIRADAAQLETLIAEHDVVLDCSDNFTTRYTINRLCHQLRKPLVSGAAIQFSGQASVFDFRRAHPPCYNCLYPEDSEAQTLRCATTGVFAPLVGIIGSLQAAEALKLIIGIETGLHARLLTLDALTLKIRTTLLKQDPSCPICQA
ncbi:MAG: molybdopterin-synthase adenylyltransferase MoeB [Gallionella sp.]